MWVILFSNASQCVKISTKVKVSTWTNLLLFVKFSGGTTSPTSPKKRRKMKLLLNKKTSELGPRTTMTILAAIAVVVMLAVLVVGAWMKKKNKFRIKKIIFSLRPYLIILWGSNTSSRVTKSVNLKFDRPSNRPKLKFQSWSPCLMTSCFLSRKISSN